METGYKLIVFKKSRDHCERYVLAFKPSEVEPPSPIIENLEEAIRLAEDYIEVNEAPSFINFNPDKDKFGIFISKVEANNEIPNHLDVRVIVDYARGTFIPGHLSPKNQVRYQLVKQQWEKNKPLREYEEWMDRTIDRRYN